MRLDTRFFVVGSFLICGWASAQRPGEATHLLLAAKARCAAKGHEYSLRGNLLEDKSTQTFVGTMVWRYRLDAIQVELRTRRDGEDQYLVLSCIAPGCMSYDTTSFSGTLSQSQLTPTLAWTCPQTSDAVELHRQLTRYINALAKATPP